ncbi:MAG TPA: AAA family ATPase, partial [Kofleriaceae bacterium]|nr:AAA family ATPase [Kofleriaceae bacterium]
RLDMSEYTDPWAAERLFGGSTDDGRLTSAVRSQPFGVVLLDEIEKAHASVFDLLLQVLGEARLTDGRGRTTYFHNAIIVLTSNLGTRSARGTLGLAADGGDDRDDRRYRDAVHAAFRPELINRLDQIVVFHPLRPHEIARVAEIAIGRLADRRGLVQAGVALDVSDRALERIADAGFSPDLGARALRRYVDAAVITPAARLLARAGADGHGGTLTVRAPDEDVARPIGSRIGAHAGDVSVALWRRAAATGRRMVRSALTLGELRRETDRELAHSFATASRHKLRELESVLATAGRKTDGRTGLPGPEIARLATEHARIDDLAKRCMAAQAELRTAEELCLEALARDIDAVDLIDAAIAQRERFRRDLFWLVTALRPVRPGATLLVHTPDAKPAVRAWVTLVLDAAARRGWRGSVHIWGERTPTWNHPWGPPHDLAWARDELSSTAALVRVAGSGADLLLGLDMGLHRFHGLAGEPCHVWVDTIETRTEWPDDHWVKLPAPPIPRPPRGEPLREVSVTAARVVVGDNTFEFPWHDLPSRLEEVQVDRVLAASTTSDGLDGLWKWPSIVPEGTP